MWDGEGGLPERGEIGATTDETPDPTPPAGRRFRLRDVGPAIIVASVVLGPGSILTASRVGAEYGAAMLWTLAAAAVVMAGTAGLAARVGVGLDRTPCGELAARLGRPAAGLVGGTLFLVVVGFQSSNNFAVLAALEPLLLAPGGTFSAGRGGLILLLVNGAAVAAVWGLRGLYGKLETLMRGLVAVMAAAFLVNLIAARPSVRAAAAGLIPSLPAGGDGGGLLALQGLVATTFSVAGAFYQAYLVREKGWTRGDGGRAGTEAVLGAAALGAMTGMILLTAAATLHARGGGGGFRSTADLAEQLRPFFGAWATPIFAAGICAGALGSFLGNALIGGTLLSDGLGRGAGIDGPWVRGFTAAALAAGAVISLTVLAGGAEKVTAVLAAQALTVLGGPLLAGALLYLGTNLDPRPPAATLAAAAVGGLVVLGLAAGTAWRLAGAWLG